MQPQRVTCHFGGRRDTHYHVLCLSNHVPHRQGAVNRRATVVIENRPPAGAEDELAAKDIVILETGLRSIGAQLVEYGSIAHRGIVHSIDGATLNVYLNVGIVRQRIAAALAVHRIHEIEHILVAVERNHVQSLIKLHGVAACN